MTEKALGWSDRHPRDVLKQHGIRARRRLGQNFLVSGKNLDRVVSAAGISLREAVLEVGTGLGRLTARIAARAGHVVSVEIDRALHALAAENLGTFENVTLLCCDFLQSKHHINPLVTEAVRSACRACGGGLKVVSNLPYCICSPAIANLLEWEIEARQMFLMAQKEVADRLVAEPGCKEYGPLTVHVDYWASVKKLFSLPRGNFWPRPEVSSVLVRIVRRPDRQRTEQYAAFSSVVRTLFTSRRKTVASAVKNRWGPDKSREALERSGIEPGTRVDQLTTADFETIAALL